MWLFNQNNQHTYSRTIKLAVMALFGMIFAACSNVDINQLDRNNQENLRKISVVNVSKREGQLYGREIRKLLYIGGKSNAAYQLTSSMKTSSSSTLSVQGTSSTLKKMSMSVSFELSDLKTGETLFKDDVVGDATFGAVTSLYGQDKSESHARERLAILMAQRVVRRLQLHFLDQEQ